jgi:hypothetical protein
MKMMLRLCDVAILGAFLAALSTPLSAVGGQKIVTGEVVDLGCHLKSIKAGGKGSTSQNHAECALQCAKKGMPVAILTADDVYTVIGDMTADDNKALIKFVNKRVTATGTVKDEDGKKLITVTVIDFEKAPR